MVWWGAGRQALQYVYFVLSTVLTVTGVPLNKLEHIERLCLAATPLQTTKRNNKLAWFGGVMAGRP